uniref:Uncharacterized protein n=1 Tax=Anguilla anguilla TaxID=7936 RepID=A0A0E9U6C0_ANGAN
MPSLITISELPHCSCLLNTTCPYVCELATMNIITTPNRNVSCKLYPP